VPSAALQEPIQSAESTATDKSAILAIINGRTKAHHDRNPLAIAAAYAPDAVIFNLAPPLVHRGIDIAEKQAWLETWEGPVVIEPRDIDITLAGDVALCHGYLRMAGNKKGVDHPVSFWMRETLCLKRSGDTWLITHEHSSVPFYMDGSLRPAFDLEP
jgi:ketosteroid isomerase-like protein